MDLPDASANRAREAGVVPDLRHGARAADGGPRRRARSRACGHDASVLDRTRADAAARSEEHTSELQSRSDLVCRLLLEKKKKKNNQQPTSQSSHPQSDSFRI